MSRALSAGVTGLEAYQKMIDVAGNNLANVGSTAFKASRITFSEMLTETIKKASQPTSTVGGTNPQQMGTGVKIAGITPTMSQGNIVNTGNPLDMAIEGEGYFVLSDGGKNVYTRAGAFAVDANSNLVDPTTGYIVQRIGTVGEADGFQVAGNSDIQVPYDVAMPANATTTMKVAGNLSSDAILATTQTNVLKSNITLTYNDGTAAGSTTLLKDLDQFSGTVGTDGELAVTGIKPDGTAVTTDASPLVVDATTTVADLLSHIDSQPGASNITASISNGRIVVTDDTAGYSQTDVKLAYTASSDGTNDVLTCPAYFEATTVGGEEVKNVNITVYDSLGGGHVLSGAFVRTSTDNTWDFILTSISGSVYELTFDNRRINGIEFDANNGSYKGLNATTGDTAQFAVTFAHDPTNEQAISLTLGTKGQFDGLTQFAGYSTAVAKEQDGYAAGSFSSVSVNNEGIVIGSFSNGIKKSIAAIQVGLFQNPSGLESIGAGYFIPSANSGEAVATQALTGGAGTIHGRALEKSNVDTAREFVDMIQAQNSYQANARTIRIANDILRELSSLIR